MCKFFLMFAAILAFTTPAFAQTYSQTGEIWSDNFVQGKFVDSTNAPTQFTWQVEWFPHLSLDKIPAPNQIENLGNVGYKFTPEWAVAVGGGVISKFDSKQVMTPVGEFRVYEQVNYNPTVGGFAFVNRVRLEERFVLGKDFALRLRLQTRGMYNFTDWFGLFASNEVFVAEQTSVKNLEPTFDQDRFFLGGRFTVNKYFAVETGYQPVFTLKGLTHVGLVNAIITVQ